MKGEFESTLEYFKTISRIPRGSENCQGMREFLCAFARQRGLEYRADSANNVIIRKVAASAYAHKAPVILQGHMDMVCVAEDGYYIDFSRDALCLRREPALVRMTALPWR